MSNLFCITGDYFVRDFLKKTYRDKALIKLDF